MANQKNKYLTLLSLFSLFGCSQDLTPQEGQEAPMGRDEARKSGYGKLFGDDILLFGAEKKYDPSLGGAARVNPLLWQAALEVVSFMPLISSDAAGGVIITDWYSAPTKLNERIKVTININDRVLRADAVHVTIHKQIKARSGDWVAATADHGVAHDMEDLILSKARQLKVEKKA